MRGLKILALVLTACAPTPTPTPEALPWTSSTMPPGPPCVHEVCGERPAALQCVYVTTGIGNRSDVCSRWSIQYERNCMCDTWATVPAPDAGVP